jgi:hypothetical protein
MAINGREITVSADPKLEAALKTLKEAGHDVGETFVDALSHGTILRNGNAAASKRCRGENAEGTGSSPGLRRKVRTAYH